MASVKKGQLTAPPQWWKHLRDWKRVFWSAERMAEREMIEAEIFECEGPNTKIGKSVKKHFGMEYRVRKEYQDMYRNGSVMSDLFPHWQEWKPFWSWYQTAKQRDQAMENLSKKTFMNRGPLYEYRPFER